MHEANGEQSTAGDSRGKRRARRLPRAVRERQILDAAVQVFAQHGYYQASMDEISEVAGISKPMIYAYLGAKDELFVACIRRESERLIGAIGGAVEESLSTEQQLWQGLRSLFEYVGNNRASWTVLRQPATSHGAPFTAELDQWRNRALTVIATLFTRGANEAGQPLQAEQAEPFAAALVGAGESMLDWWSEHPEHSADGLAMRLMNMMWMGFGDLVEGRTWTPESTGSKPTDKSEKP